jgi:hypothetical protein
MKTRTWTRLSERARDSREARSLPGDGVGGTQPRLRSPQEPRVESELLLKHIGRRLLEVQDVHDLLVLKPPPSDWAGTVVTARSMG